MHNSYIMHIRRCGFDMMNPAGFAVDPDMDFVPEVPLVSLFRLMSLGITLTISVFCRWWRCDQR